MELEDAITVLIQKRSQITKAGTWNSPQQLSEVAIQIGTYLTYLGEHLPKLEEEYLAKRSETYKSLLESGKSASASETEARYSTIKQRGQYERVKQFHSDFKGLISIIQSHLKIMTEAEKGHI